MEIDLEILKEYLNWLMTIRDRNRMRYKFENIISYDIMDKVYPLSVIPIESRYWSDNMDFVTIKMIRPVWDGYRIYKHTSIKVNNYKSPCFNYDIFVEWQRNEKIKTILTRF